MTQILPPLLFSMLYLTRFASAGGHAYRSQTFKDIGVKVNTDKVTGHRYDSLYQKYLESHRLEKLKLLEIGLGCGMHYGPGHSLQLWAEYLPYTALYFMEYDGNCVEQQGAKWHADFKQLKKVYVGDQANRAHLQPIVDDHAEKDFDIIIDDGGHTMKQQLTSFEVLWPLVKPGGYYVVEDLISSYATSYGGKGEGQDGTMVNFIKSALDYLHCNPRYKGTLGDYKLSDEFCAHYNLKMQGLMSVDCFSSICILTKTVDDTDIRK